MSEGGQTRRRYWPRIVGLGIGIYIVVGLLVDPAVPDLTAR